MVYTQIRTHGDPKSEDSNHQQTRHVVVAVSRLWSSLVFFFRGFYPRLCAIAAPPQVV